MALSGAPAMLTPVAPTFLAPRYSFSDAISYARAATVTIRQFHGVALDGPEMSVDLPPTSSEFQIPVVFIQGEQDHSTPAVLARDYFERISAPQEAYVAIEGGGHAAIIGSLDQFRSALDTYVRPLVSPSP